MTEVNQVYKCEVCGNMIEVIHKGAGQLVCCGRPMTLKIENTVDAAKEKHVPVIEKAEEGLVVKVGEVSHPMEDKHYIEWIEVITTNRVYKKFLKPGEKPEACFKLCKDELDGDIIVREYCNLHGLWKNA